MSRAKSIRLVTIVYLVCFIIGAGLTYYLDSPDPISQLFFIDIVLTIVVFLVSYKQNNASVYDAYWSVIPFFMIFYWLYIFGIDFISLKVILATFAISFWSWRLTANWLRGWTGMAHEDWRYIMLREKTGKWYPLVNFLGIHLFPTLMVFFASIPLYYIFEYANDFNWVTGVGFIVAVLGTIIEMTADNQLHRFKKTNKNPMAVMRQGIWRSVRHPNYLGEITFWVGLFLMSYTPYLNLYSGAGFVLMILMFVFISIPMIDKKMLQSKPEYTIYKESTWSLLPKLWK